MKMCINFIVLWPFLGAFLTFLAGKIQNAAKSGSNRLQNVMAAVTVAAEIIAAAAVQYLVPPFTAERFVSALRTSADGMGTLPMGPAVSLCWQGFCGVGLSFTVDGFRSIYVLIAAFMWLVCTLFSFSYMKHYANKGRYYFFLLLTLGATMGSFLSADFFTMFVFFEIMSLASYVWIAQDEKRESLRAAETYLAIAVIGGLCILMGMFLLYGETGTLSVTGELFFIQEGVSADNGRLTAAGILMLTGFAAKAGAVPLHIWLPKAHPVAPAPASALLSGVLTKTGVFGTMLLTLQLFFGKESFGTLIFTLGILTMVTGAVLALYSVDLKRTLACSSVSQIGFIFTGLGMAGMLAGRASGQRWYCAGLFPIYAEKSIEAEGYLLSLKGTVLHMVNHSLIKLVLFCAAGVVFMNLHKLNLNEICGFGRKKPLLHAVFLAGALGIAGVPFFNGYVSKSLIHEGMVLWQEAYPSFFVKGAEWLFIISGGLTAAYMMKIYIALFWEKNRDEARQEEYETCKKYMTPLTGVMLLGAAAIFPIMGILAGIFQNTFTPESISGALLSLASGALVYLFIVRKWMIKDGVYVDRWNRKWDLEELVYRPFLAILDIAVSTVCRFFDCLPDYLVVALRKTVYKDSPLPHELEEGDALTHAVGVLVDDGKEALNHTVYKKHPIKISFEHKLALLSKEMKENNVMIARSLSFGLLLFCIGLLLTLLYMLVV